MDTCGDVFSNNTVYNFLIDSVVDDFPIPIGEELKDADDDFLQARPLSKAEREAQLTIDIANLVLKSPYGRTHTKNDLETMKKSYGVTDRGFLRCLNEARLLVPDNNWAVGGRPRKAK